MAFIARGHNAITGKAAMCGAPTCTWSPAVARSPSRRGDAGAARATLTRRAALEGVAHQPAIQGGGESDAAHGQGRPRRRPEEEDTPTGTAFRFTLNTTATVRIAILQRVTGRKVGKQCLKTTPKRKRLRPCKRFEEIGKLERTAVPGGLQTVAFSGRLGKRKLPAGSYQARLIASTSGGSSAPVTVAFTIVRR